MAEPKRHMDVLERVLKSMLHSSLTPRTRDKHEKSTDCCDGPKSGYWPE